MSCLRKMCIRDRLEAAFMTGLERNADIVHMATYAPLFAHVEGLSLIHISSKLVVKPLAPLAFRIARRANSAFAAFHTF